MKKTKNTAQVEEAKGILKKVFSLFTRGTWKIRSATLTDELVNPGGKRLVLFFTTKDKKK